MAEILSVCNLDYFIMLFYKNIYLDIVQKSLFAVFVSILVFWFLGCVS